MSETISQADKKLELKIYHAVENGTGVSGQIIADFRHSILTAAANAVREQMPAIQCMSVDPITLDNAAAAILQIK